MPFTRVAQSGLASRLRNDVKGDVIGRDDATYDAARAVWNGLIDRHPEVIVRCADEGDVIACVAAARTYRPPVSVRGGGHQVAGSAVCDDGLVIDLSPMRAVEVDPVARIARVQGGARWGDVDAATQKYGLGVPGGEISETGVGGLTLGGGLGLLQRTYGLSCDNVIGLTIVTADGAVRTVNAHENSDLFWAARGAGRGLGVVTEFIFALHPVGPDVASAGFVFPADDAAAIGRAWRELANAAPETVAPQLMLWQLPPFPGVPDELVGKSFVFAFGTFIGDPEDAAPVLAPFASLGRPVMDLSGTSSWVDVQSSYDDLLPDGGRYYWKSHFIEELSDELIDLIVEHAARRPDAKSAVIIRTLGGAIDRLRPDDTAFAHRSARFNISIDAMWADPALDEASIAWARGLWDAMVPYSTGVYMNFAGFGVGVGEEPVHGLILGAHEERVERIRARYDPDGVFAQSAAVP